MIPYGQPASFRAPVEEIIIEKIDELISGTRQLPSARAAIRSIETGPFPGTAKAVVVKDAPLAHTRQVLPVNDAGKIEAGNAQAQIDQVLDNLEQVLRRAGASLATAVKVNVYVTGGDVAAVVSRAFNKRFAGLDTQPAVSLVAGKLSRPDALVAMDAVAVAGRTTEPSADVAILPAGPRVYISGQASPGEFRMAVTNTLKTLGANLEFLELTRADVVQAKVFLQPMSSASVVEDEIRAFFGGNAPPVVFVDWLSKTPVEIELIVKGAHRGSRPGIEYLTPPEEKRARVFTRIVRVHDPEIIYVSGLYGAGDGAAQIRTIFDSLKNVLGRNGSDLRHLAKATYYVSDDNTSRLLNEIRPEYYEDGRAPAASKAVVPGTGLDGRTITLDMIAVPRRQ